MARAAALYLALTALTSDGIEAQAICSAPHSSPTLALSGEIQTLLPGSGWIQLSIHGQHATEFFNFSGQRQPFLADSEYDTRSVFLTAALGLWEGLEVWAQVPTHRLTVQSAGGNSASTGLGDVRVAARVSSELFGVELPLAVRGGVKVPGSEFPIDATIVPLTEGQVDAEVSLEAGSALGDLPLYAAGWVGYRWRGANTRAARQPGNERFVHAAVGGWAGDMTWEIAADGLWGEAPVAQGLVLVSEKRRLIQLLPTLGYAVGPGHLDVTAQVPITGQALPAAFGLSVGYRLGWGI